MTALRLRGTCPECGFIERLRPDGTMVQHTAPRRWIDPHTICEGTGREPVAGSVAAWLDAQDAAARAAVERTGRAVAEAEAALGRALERANAVTKATAKARARLARMVAETEK